MIYLAFSPCEFGFPSILALGVAETIDFLPLSNLSIGNGQLNCSLLMPTHDGNVAQFAVAFFVEADDAAPGVGMLSVAKVV